MKELQIFKNEKFGEMRTLKINNEPWFVAKDVCDILEIKNTTQAIQRLDEDERTMLNIGRQGNTNIVNEYGLYNLILASRKKESKDFKRWVTHEVLPSIRTTGGYIAGEENMSEDELILKAMNVLNTKIENLKQKNRQLELDNEKQSQLIGELRPKADYTDKILQSKGTVTINAIANDYGLTAIAMNKKLHELGIQYKQGNQWLLYREYRTCGYTHSKTIHFFHKDGRPDTRMNMEWTQKGRLFIYNLLKNKGIVPLIEKGEQKCFI